MASPDEVTVWIGLDVGKEEHFADVLDDHGDRLFSRSISNDEADLTSLLEAAAVTCTGSTPPATSFSTGSASSTGTTSTSRRM